jgi:hypothetical protein
VATRVLDEENKVHIHRTFKIFISMVKFRSAAEATGPIKMEISAPVPNFSLEGRNVVSGICFSTTTDDLLKWPSVPPVQNETIGYKNTLFNSHPYG